MSQNLKDCYHTLCEKLLAVCTSRQQATAEAVLILAHALQCETSVLSNALHQGGDELINESRASWIEVFLQQRMVKRIPIQYLLHQSWFYGLRFYVNPSVLIPRPETELLVEAALSAIKPGMTILDIGTGPGTIALTLSHVLIHGQKSQLAHPENSLQGSETIEPAEIKITATDLSESALQVARINQKMLGTQVELAEPGDLFTPVDGRTFDLILSNPPYIDSALKPDLAPEILWHEPGLALFPPDGTDALHYYRRIAAEGLTYLNPGGMVILEIGSTMGKAVQTIFLNHGYRDVRLVKDYARLDRIVTALMP